MNNHRHLSRCRGGLRAMLAGAVALAMAGPAAGSPRDPLSDAEAASARVDFEAVRTSAQLALKRGGYERSRIIRIYYLLGVSSAALGQEEAAMEAFKRLLDLDPQTRLDQDLSPKLRSPMHEARGFWASRTDHLALEVTFARGDGVLHLQLTDTLPMGHEVLVQARVGTAGPFHESRVPSSPVVSVPIPGAAGAVHIEYAAVLLDPQGNRLIERGTQVVPLVVDFSKVDRPASDARSTAALPVSSPRGSNRRGFLVAGILGELLAAGAIAGGAFAWIQASDAAQRWNDDTVCLAGGKSRQANCGNDRTTAETAQTAAIVTFSVGGALFVASTALLLAAPRAERVPVATATNLRCGPGPGFGLACGGQF